MSALSAYLQNPVVVITTDGRCFSGILQGYDNNTNIVLSDTQERIISPNDITEFVDLGLYIVRGESVAICGLVDQEINDSIDWTKVHGNQLISTKHGY